MPRATAGRHPLGNRPLGPLLEARSVAVVGETGSGKTTLLKQVLGLAKPDAGTILVNGVDITACAASELTAVRRRIGVAFQGSALFSSMTIAEKPLTPRKNSVLVVSIPARLRRSDRLRTVFYG